MKTIKKNIGNRFQLSLEKPSSIEDLKEWDILILKNLLFLKGQKASLITLDPQEYSIGNGLNNCQKIKRLKKEFLINWDITLSEDFIQLISKEEEFERGLIFIVLSEKIVDIFNIIDTINPVGSIDFKNLDTEIIVLEDDGETFVWNNPSRVILTELKRSNIF